MVTVDGDASVDVAMLPAFFRDGFGSDVIDVPASVRFLRVQTSVADACETFTARVNGKLLVNLRIGSRCRPGHPLPHDVYGTTGGVMEIEAAPFVQWSMQQVDTDLK